MIGGNNKLTSNLGILFSWSNFPTILKLFGNCHFWRWNFSFCLDICFLSLKFDCPPLGYLTLLNKIFSSTQIIANGRGKAHLSTLVCLIVPLKLVRGRPNWPSVSIINDTTTMLTGGHVIIFAKCSKLVFCFFHYSLLIFKNKKV